MTSTAVDKAQGIGPGWPLSLAQTRSTLAGTSRWITAISHPVATPVIDHLKVTARHVEIGCTWHTGAGRHAAIAALVGRLNGDLGAALVQGGDVMASLRPFLALRILGVIPLHQMTGPHAIACLAKLAELSRPGVTVPGWCASTPPRPPEAADIHSLLLILQQNTDRQYFYLARPHAWSASPADRSGPEFNDPARGTYHLQPVQLSSQALTTANLKPDPLAQFLIRHITAGDDLFALPDLRASRAHRRTARGSTRHDGLPLAKRRSHAPGGRQRHSGPLCTAPQCALSWAYPCTLVSGLPGNCLRRTISQ